MDTSIQVVRRIAVLDAASVFLRNMECFVFENE